MRGYNKIFLDTTPIIYFLDVDVNFGERTRQIFEEILSNDRQMVSSVITCTEYLTFPYRTGNTEKIDVFFEFCKDCGIILCPVSSEIAQKAAKIRAEYKDFKTMDALQLASACIQGCDLFLTNDRQRRQFKEIRCIVLDEWES